MKLKDIQNTFHVELDAIYASKEVDSLFYILLDAFYRVSRIQLVVNPELKTDKVHLILDALQLLKQQKPIQYILGETEFYGLPFKVSEHTLIPRPETEELVAWVLSVESSINRPLKILDIGTGSGCIAIALANNLPNARIYALDVSKDALEIAKHNAELNKVKIEFLNVDILNAETWGFNDLKFDIIVSNPPYVRAQEKELMKPNVLENEPHLALFVTNENPLQFYDAITKFAIDKLSHSGLLFFEINEYLGNDMMQMLKQNKFENIELRQDMFKKDRMIKAVLV
ncbi:peptide chain release factor N(5)-glutamine methyltransferase [uncultured Algibacter sp.]|uniref:peptide chain release factor N(5)-glutamine methyltransferase n=1 Tax=uncultured Algibacter sp. TaxID=298659 RepID=UPI003217CA3B